MTINATRQLACELIQKHVPEYTFKFTNSKITFGECNYCKRIIAISRHLAIINDESVVKNTILHEIAHALTPGCHHNRLWKVTARRIGCDGERCYSAKKVNVPTTNYVGICPNCGRKIYRYRKRALACHKCCEKYNNAQFDERYKFEWSKIKNI